MDEEFDLLQAARESLAKEKNREPLINGGTSESIREQYRFGELTKSNAAPISDIKPDEEPEFEEAQGAWENTMRFGSSIVANIAASFDDFMGGLLDVADWHHTILPKYAGAGLQSEILFTPLRNISKWLDNTIGDGEDEVGNFITDRAAELRRLNELYNTVNITGSGGKEGGLGGWTEWSANGFSNLIGSVAGNLAASGTTGGLSNLTKLPKAINIITGAFAATNATGMSIAQGVYDDTVDYHLEQNEDYKQQKDAIFENAKQEYLQNNPDADPTTKWGDSEMYAQEKVKAFKEQYMQNNSDVAENAKKMGILGAETSLKTNALTFFLNLGMAKLATKGATPSRSYEEVTKWASKETAKEMGQEAAEESIFESLAEKRGLAYGRGADGYSVSDAANDLFLGVDENGRANWRTTLESAFWGGIGGGLTTGGINRATYKNRLDQNQKAIANIEQQNKILANSGSATLKDFIELSNTAQDNANLVRQQQKLLAEGKEEEAKAIGNRMIINQALQAFKTGTTENLQKVYESLAKDERNSPEQRANAQKALVELTQLEQIYNESTSKGYKNSHDVFINKSQQHMMNKSIMELNNAIALKEAEVLEDLTSANKTGELPSLKAKQIKRGDRPGDVTISEGDLDFSIEDLFNTRTTTDNKEKFAELNTQISNLQSDLDNAIKNNPDDTSTINKLETDLKYKQAELKQLTDDTALEMHQTNLVNNYSNAARSKVQSVRELEQLRNSKENLEEFLGETKKAYNTMTSKQTQKEIAYEEKIRQDILGGGIGRFQNTLGNAIRNTRNSLSEDEFSKVLDKYFKKHEKKLPKGRIEAIKKQLIKAKELADNLQQKKVEQKIVESNQKEQANNPAPVVESNIVSETAIDDMDAMMEFAQEVDFELTDFSNTQTASNNLNNILGGVTDPFGAIGDFSKLEVQPEVGPEDSGEEDFPLPEGDVDFDNEGDIPDDLKDVLADPLEAKSDLSQEQIQSIKDGISNYKEVLEAALGRPTTFEDLVKDFIKTQGLQNADKYFNLLVKGWQLNNYPTANFKEVYNKLFKTTKEIGASLVSSFETMVVNQVVTTQEELEAVQEKVIQEVADDYVENPPIHVGPRNEPESRKIAHKGFVSSNTDPSLTYVSRPGKQLPNGDWIYTSDDLNRDSDLSNPHKLLDPDKFLPGTKLQVKVADNYESIFVTIYDASGIPIHALPFGDWVTQNGIVPYSQEWLDKVPMMMVDEDGDTVAFVTDVNAINPAKFREVNEGDIEKARNNEREIRKAVWAAHTKNQTEEIEITYKGQGVHDGSKLPSSSPMIPLSQANPQTILAVRDDKGIIWVDGKEFQGKLLNKEPLKTSSGKYISQFEIRRIGTEIIDGKPVPTYRAFPFTNKPITNQDITNIQNAIALYGTYFSTVVSPEQKQAAKNAIERIRQITGIDLSTPQGLEEYLSQYIVLMKGQKGLDNSKAIFEYANKSGLAKGTPYVYINAGVVYFGQVGEAMTKSENYPVIFINPKGFKSNIVTSKFFEGKFSQNVSKDVLGRGKEMVNIGNDFSVQSTGMTYENFIKSAVVTNMISYNIGTAENPKHVTAIQPKITYKLTNQQQAIPTRELNQGNEVVQEAEKRIVEIAPVIEKLEIAKEEKIDSIQENTSIPETIKEEQIQKAEQETQEEIQQVVENIIPIELLNEVKKQALEDTSWIGDNDIFYDPVEQSQDVIDQVVSDMLKIPGLATHHQYQLVEYIFNQLITRIKPDINAKLDKKEIMDNILVELDTLLEGVIKTYNDRKQILAAFPNDNQATELVSKYDQALSYIQNIRNNADIIAKDGYNKIAKYTGIQEVKEEQGEEVQVDGNTEVDVNYSKTYLEESAKSSATLQVKRFLAGVEDIDKDGNKVSGFLGTTTYIGFDDMFNTLQAILAGSSPDLNQMIDILTKYQEGMPFLKSVVERLKAADTQTQNQFVTLMARDQLNMEFVMYSYNKQTGAYGLEIFNTNSTSMIRTIRKTWKNNFKAVNNPLTKVIDGQYHINYEEAEKLHREYLSFTERPVSVKSNVKQGILNLNPGLASSSITLGNSETEERIKQDVSTGFKSMSINDKTYVLTLEGNTLKIKEYIPSPVQSLFTGTWNKEGADILLAWLEDFGITLSENTMKSLVEKGLKHGKGKEAMNFPSLFTPTGIFGILDNFAKSFDANSDTLIEGGKNNPTNDTIFNSLAKLESRFNKSITPNSFRDGSKTIQGYTVSKFITDRAADLISDDDTVRQQLGNTSFSKHSMWLRLLSDPNKGAAFRDTFEVIHLGINAIKEIGKTLYKENSVTSLADADHELTKLGMFMNMQQGDSPEVDGFSTRVARMFSLTMSDKTTMTLIKTAVLNLSPIHFDFKQVGNKEDNKTMIVPKEELTAQVYDQLVKPELERIISFRQKGSSTDIKGYNDGAGLFLMFPKLNSLKFDGITLFEWLKGGKDMAWVEEKMKDALFKEVNNYIISQTQNKLKVWKNNGYITSEGGVITGFKFFDNKYMAKFDSLDQVGHKVQAAAMDFVINSLIANANSMMMFTGDPAVYFKSGSSDFINMAKDTATNMNKRFANQIAPGTKLADSDNNQYTQIFLEDIATHSSNLEFLTKILDGETFTKEDEANWIRIQNISDKKQKREESKKFLSKYPNSAKYFKVEGTDAQEYTTWQEHLYVLEKLGKTPDVALDISPSDIRRAREIFSTGTPLDQLSDVDKHIVKMVMQPIKPVYTGQMYDANQDVMRTLYIKCSSIPLIPQLTQGLEIDKLRVKMEELENKSRVKNADGSLGRPTKTVRASYESANKVGALTKPVKLFNNSTASMNDITVEDLEASSLTLDRSNFRIQQDVPFKAGMKAKDEVTLGTQTTKLLFGDGITEILEKVFELEGEKYNGKDLHQEYTKTFDKLLQFKKHLLYEDLGIDPKTNKPFDVKKSARKIGQLLKEEAESRGYSKQVVDSIKMVETPTGNIEFTLPLWMSAESNRFESLLNAIIVNRISKIKMPGNAYVAGSQEGFKQVNQYTGDKSKIVYTSKWQGELKGAEFDEQGNLKKTQVLLPSRFRDNKGNLIDLFSMKDGQYTYVTGNAKDGWRLKEDMFDKELFSNISFRIPTSAHLSMADIEIVGFLPYEVGDLMIVPRNLTVQIGLDFDIDKQTNYHLWHKMDENGKFKVMNYDIDEVEKSIKDAKQQLDSIDFKQIEEDIEDAKIQSKENINKYNEEIKKLKETKAGQEELLSTIFSKKKELELMLKAVNNEIAALEKANQNTDVNNLFKLFGLTDDIALAHEEEMNELLSDKASFEKQIEQIKSEIDSISKTKVRKEDLSSTYLAKTLRKENDLITKYQAIEQKRAAKNEKKALKTYIKEANKLVEKLLQNKIVKIHSSVLSNPATQSRVSKVLSIDYAKEQSEMIEELIESNSDNSYFTPVSDEYQKANMFLGASGKIGIGAYSIDVVFHSLIKQNPQELTLQDVSTDGNGNKVVKPKEIRFGNIVSKGKLGLSNTLLPNRTSYYIQYLKGEQFQDEDTAKIRQLLTNDQEENVELGLSFIEGLATYDERYKEMVDSYTKNQRAISEVLGERQNIATDNAKEVVMAKVNLNSKTLDVDKVMTLLGFDKGEDGNSITFLFLSQPIVRDYVKELENISANISEFVADKEAAVIQKLREKYPTPNAISDFSSYDRLMTNDAFIQELSGKHNNTFQQAVLEKFIELKNIGKEIRKIQGTLNVDSKGLGKSTFDVIDRLDKLDSLAKNETISNATSLIGDYKLASDLTIEDQEILLNTGYVRAKDYFIKPTTVAGSFTVNATIPANELWGQYFPYDTPTANSIFNELLLAMNTAESAQVEMKQTIIQEMRKFVNSYDFDLYTLSPQEERKRLFLDVPGKNTSLATYLQELMQSDGNKEVDTFIKKNRLLNRFEFDTNSNGDISIIKFNNAVGENFDEEQLYNAIPALMAKKIPLPPYNGKPYNTQMLGQDLINYALLEGGVQEVIQFSKFIPVSYLNAVGYSSTIRGINLATNVGNFFGTVQRTMDAPYLVSKFSVQFAQHNPNLFPKVKKDDLVNPVFHGGEIYSFNVLEEKGIPKPFYTIYNSKLDGDNKFQLYQFDGEKYVRIPVKGKFGLNEYNAQIQDNTVETTIIQPTVKSTNTTVKMQAPTSAKPEVKSVVHNIDKGNIGDVISSIAQSDYGALSDMAKALLPFVDATVKVKIGDLQKAGTGVYAPNQHTIWMDQDSINIKDAESTARTFVHETVHSITHKELRKYIEFESDGQIKQVKPDAPSHIFELVRLFNQARTHLNKDGKLDTVIEKFNRLKAKHLAKQEITEADKLTAEERRITYGGYSIDEFLTMVTTSPEFQAEMNKVQYLQSGLTLWEKYKQVIAKVLTAIGVYNENSIAAHAIDNTFKLLEYAKNPDAINNFAVNQNEVQEVNDLDKEIQTALDLFDQKPFSNEKVERLFVRLNYPISEHTKEAQILLNNPNPTVQQVREVLDLYDFDLSADISDTLRIKIEKLKQDILNSFNISTVKPSTTNTPFGIISDDIDPFEGMDLTDEDVSDPIESEINNLIEEFEKTCK